MNWAVCLAVFVPLYFFVWLGAGSLAAFLVSMVVVFCLYFFVCDKRTIAIRCSNKDCGNPIYTNTPWICGFKKCRNDCVDEFPFISRCQHCGAEPKAYECHHCGELIFFTEDQQKANYAHCVNSQPAQDPQDEEISKRKREIELAELDLRKAEFEIKKNSVNKELNPEKPKSVKDRLRSRVGSKTELDDEVKRLKAEIDKEFKDDPGERERRHRLVEAEARDLLR